MKLSKVLLNNVRFRENLLTLMKLGPNFKKFLEFIGQNVTLRNIKSSLVTLNEIKLKLCKIKLKDIKF